MRKFAAFLTIVAVGVLLWWLHQRQRGLDVALIQTAFRINPTRVAELIKSGASPNARYGQSGPEHFKGSDGGYPMAANRWTALIALANSDAAGDRVPIAKLLLDAGADINADDGYGDTALAECCYQNREPLALFLLERGANPNTRTGVYIDGTGNIAPVHRATQNPTILRALIQHGADVNVLDDAGNSPLDWATRDDKQEVVHILIVAGARQRATHP